MVATATSFGPSAFAPRYAVPTRMTCWVQQGISFEAPISQISPTGVFIETTRKDLGYTESIKIRFHTEIEPAIEFEGIVAAWVRGRGVRIEALPTTPSKIIRVLSAWSEGRAADKPEDSIASKPAARGLDGRRVLVIDDDPGVLKMVRRLLGKQGCDVSVTTSPPWGLDFVEQSAVDAVVMDWMLPSIPGQDLLKRLRGSHPELPVAVLSGSLVWDNAEQTLESMGASAILHKPLDFPRLVTWLEAVTYPTLSVV